MVALSASKLAQRTALALNNQAVGLLQHGDFVGANKLCSTSANLLENLMSGDQDAVVAASLHNAQHCSTSAAPSSSAPLSSTLELMVVEDADFSALRSAVQYGCSSSVFFAVILRDNDDHDTLNETSVARQHALVLYNRAVLCLMRHYQYKCELPRNEQLSNNNKDLDAVDPTRTLRMARKFLNRSSAALCAVAEDHASSGCQTVPDETTTTSHEEDEAAFTTTRVELLLASALVLNSLSLALRVLRQPQKAQVALQAAQNLSTLLDQEEAQDEQALLLLESSSSSSLEASPRTTAASLFAPVHVSPAA